MTDPNNISVVVYSETFRCGVCDSGYDSEWVCPECKEILVDGEATPGYYLTRCPCSPNKTVAVYCNPEMMP